MRAVVFVALLAVLAGCQTTQDRSAALAAKAQGALKEKRQQVGATNASAVAERTTLVRADGAVAAVIEVRNRGAAQAQVPVALSVRGADGKVAFRNDAPGLDPSLAVIPALGEDERRWWVNDQVTAGEDATRASARLGVARGKAPRELPELEVGDVKLSGDSSGVSIVGTVANRSEVAQRRVPVFCVARKGGKVVAAGRALVEAIPAGDSASFTMYPVGDPRGADLTTWAPPTELGGAG